MAAPSTLATRASGFFPVRMRIAPTAVETSGDATHYGGSISGATVTNDFVPSYSGFTTAEMWTVVNNLVSSDGTFATGAAGIAITRNAAAYLGWSAEL
jgi:hypothetical protein